jgi:hypothetical protein
MKKSQIPPSSKASFRLPLVFHASKVRQALLIVTAITLVVFSNTSQAQQQRDKEPSVQPLRILYAGELEHPRTAEFVDFLKTRFSKVSTIAFADLSTETAADSDVVVIDIPGSDMETFRRISLPERFDRSTILFGINGARLGEKEELKLNDA